MDDRLGPLFEVIAATGLRRGEACGSRWSDVDLEREHIVVRQQLVQGADDRQCRLCGQVHAGTPSGLPRSHWLVVVAASVVASATLGAVVHLAVFAARGRTPSLRTA